MGRKIKTPAEMLEQCFSRLEWEYLTRHPDFQKEWNGKCKTLDDVERLSEFGSKLIADRDAPHFKKPPNHRLRMPKQK